jgi:hypothetical protein
LNAEDRGSLHLHRAFYFRAPCADRTHVSGLENQVLASRTTVQIRSAQRESDPFFSLGKAACNHKNTLSAY